VTWADASKRGVAVKTNVHAERRGFARTTALALQPKIEHTNSIINAERPDPGSGSPRAGSADDMSGPNTQNRSRRALVMGLATALVVVLLAVGAWLFRDRWPGGFGYSSDLKVVIRKFLQKQSGVKVFTVPDEPPSVEAVATVSTNATTTTTNKPGRIRTAKAAKLGLPGSAWSTWFRTAQEQAPSYRDMYRLIGQQLTLAERLLTNASPQEQITGLIMASEASAYARTNTINIWLGARICEAYLWPNLGMVETNKGGQLTSDALLNMCDIAFKEAGETNNIIKNYEMVLAKSPKAAQADVFHYRLGRIYMDMGENQKALVQFQQIKNRTTRMERDFNALQVLIGAGKSKPAP